MKESEILLRVARIVVPIFVCICFFAWRMARNEDSEYKYLVDSILNKKP
jgi:preprotein translocase subunit YajC